MICLYRTDPEANMARFYALSLERGLFGEVLLRRVWGRIGRRGQERLESFADTSAAERVMARLCAAKRRRGYAPRPPAALPPDRI